METGEGVLGFAKTAQPNLQLITQENDQVKRQACFLLIFLVFVNFGCSNSVELATSTEITPTNEKSSTCSPQPLSTSTMATTKTPVITKTSTPLPSLTLQATYSLAEWKLKVNELQQDNGKCNFPCIWGIDPQKTIADDAKAFFQLFGNFIIPDESIELYVYITPFDPKSEYGSGELFLQRSKQDLILRTWLWYVHDANGKIWKLVFHSYVAKI